VKAAAAAGPEIFELSFFASAFEKFECFREALHKRAVLKNLRARGG
jgi:hypothetical protein